MQTSDLGSVYQAGQWDTGSVTLRMLFRKLCIGTCRLGSIGKTVMSNKSQTRGYSSTNLDSTYVTIKRSDLDSNYLISWTMGHCSGKLAVKCAD